MAPAITLEHIRLAAEQLANRHNDTAACSAMLQAEIKAAITPILERYKATLDGYAAAEARAMGRLDELLMAAPNLFAKPRSLAVDGVRCGYKKEADTVDWADDAELIARIRALKPELVPILIRTEESLVLDALGGLDAADRQLLGLRTITGADRRFITVGDNDVEKLARTILADAARRQGEDETPKSAKGKTKAKAAEVAA